MKNKLASWSPEYLKTLYALEFDKVVKGQKYDPDLKEQVALTPIQKEVFAKKTEALCRLGTCQHMKEVWVKLLAKDASNAKNEKDKEEILVGGIHEALWLSALEVKRKPPEDIEDELSGISEAIKALQKMITRSGIASYEDKGVIGDILRERYMIGQNESTGLSFSNVLEYYSRKMDEHSKSYKKHYAKGTSDLSRQLSRLMQKLYGTPLDGYVGIIVSTILDESKDTWDKDKVGKIRKYKSRK